MQVSSPATDVVALSDAAPIPGLGFLPVNAYVVHAEQPVLVDSRRRVPESITTTSTPSGRGTGVTDNVVQSISSADPSTVANASLAA